MQTVEKAVNEAEANIRLLSDEAGEDDGPILLVQPSFNGKAALAATLATSENLGLAYLAAALEQTGHPCTLLDLEGSPMLPQEFADFVQAGRYRLVGFSPTSRSAPSAVSLVRAIRECCPDTLIVWGGHLATGLGVDAFRLVPGLDAVVVGEGEQLIVLIARLLRSGRFLPGHPRVLINPQSEYSPIPSVLDPDTRPWTQLTPKRVLTPEAYREKGARVVTTLGCRHDCDFCTSPGFYGRRVVRRSLEHVMTEIDSLVKTQGVRQIWINDDLFIDGSRDSNAWGLAFASSFRERYPGVRFRPMCRADTFIRATHVLDALVAAGMNAMFVGLESGDDSVLAELNKRSSVANGRWIAAELKLRSVMLQPGFIMFTPDSTTETIRNSVKFLYEIGQLYRLFPVTRTMNIFPGTKMWSVLTASGEVDEQRSTDFLLIPRFRQPAVRELSIAFERLEEQFAPLDSSLYRFRSSGAISTEVEHAVSDMIRGSVLGAVEIAERGADASQIERLVMRIWPGIREIIRNLEH